MGRGCWREKKNSKTGTRTAKGCWLHSYGVRVFVFLLPFYLSGLFWHIWSSFFAKCGYECESVFTFGLALECLMKVRVSVSVRKFDQMMCRLNIRTIYMNSSHRSTSALDLRGLFGVVTKVI